MALEDECKQLMYYRDKIKELKKGEEEVKSRIIAYLKNHNQEGVIFKHKDKNVTLMVESTSLKKNVSKKEKEKKVQNILANAGVQDIDLATKEIINGLKQVSLTDKPYKDKLKLKTNK
jgi:predicted transport protein